jgi:hypothetical protein
MRRLLPLLVSTLLACSGGSTAMTQTTDAGAAVPNNPASDGGAPSSSDGGADATPTGDVWLDTTGAILGSARSAVDGNGNTSVALIDGNGITWRANTTTIEPLDSLATWYYDGENCKGNRWLGDAFDGVNVGLPRPGVSTSFAFDDNHAYAVKSTAIIQERGQFASYDNPTYGCQATVPSQSGMGYAEADTAVVTPPKGTPPFHIEHH